MDKMRPIEIAAAHCREKGIVFEKLFLRYVFDPASYMISNPFCFALARPVELESRPAWLVELAAGDLRQLISALPFQLPFIAFHRNAQSKLRVYRLDRFVQLTKSIAP